MALCGVIATVPVWMMRGRSGRPPRRRWRPAARSRVRPPTMRYTPSRDRAMRTGRPASLAAAAPSTWCCHKRLGAEAAADIGRGDVHLRLIEAEHVGERPGGMRDRLDASWTTARRRSTPASPRAARSRCGCGAGSDTLASTLSGAAASAASASPIVVAAAGPGTARLGALRLGRGERRSSRLGRVGGADQGFGVVGLLLRFGQHDGDRLAVPVDAVVLHDRQVVAASGRRRADMNTGMLLHARRVRVRHDQHDPGRRLGRAVSSARCGPSASVLNASAA